MKWPDLFPLLIAYLIVNVLVSLALALRLPPAGGIGAVAIRERPYRQSATTRMSVVPHGAMLGR